MYVRPRRLGMGFSSWNEPLPINRKVGMHALSVHQNMCDSIPLSTNFWSQRVRRSEMPLPCVRRPGAWAGMRFSGWNEPPPYNPKVGMHALSVQQTKYYSSPLFTNFWSNWVRRSEFPMPFSLYEGQAPGIWNFSFTHHDPGHMHGGQACAFGAPSQV